MQLMSMQKKLNGKFQSTQRGKIDNRKMHNKHRGKMQILAFKRKSACAKQEHQNKFCDQIIVADEETRIDKRNRRSKQSSGTAIVIPFVHCRVKSSQPEEVKNRLHFFCFFFFTSSHQCN